MAKRTKSTAAAPPVRGRTRPLTSFLASVDRFTETISAQVVAVTPDEEQRLVIASTAQSFVAQTRKLTDFLRKATAGIGPGQLRDLDDFLSVQDGDAIVTRALRVTTQMLTPGRASLRTSFLGWLDEVIYTIKKIIMEIFDLIFHKVPGWLVTILAIIDELIKLVKSLLAEVFGIRMAEVADEGSRSEINFLHELTAMAELKAAHRLNRGSDDENSSNGNGA
jgi:hypothetical protein